MPRLPPTTCCRTGSPDRRETSWHIAEVRSSICGYKLKNGIGLATLRGRVSFEECSWPYPSRTGPNCTTCADRAPSGARSTLALNESAESIYFIERCEV